MLFRVTIRYKIAGAALMKSVVIDQLEKVHVECHYNAEKRIAYVTYKGILDADASDSAYDWLYKLIGNIGVDHLYGEVFNFRGVTVFTTENLIDAMRKSRKMNISITAKTRLFPVAMIVANTMQEEILRGPMRVPPENVRKRIVYSMEEAHRFLDQWHTTTT